MNTPSSRPWIVEQADAALDAFAEPSRPDARLNADPVTFLMSSLGRISDLRAGITGGIVSYGRKPWRFLALGNIVADGV